MQLIGAATPDVPNQTPMPQPSKQLLNACPVPPMDIVVTLLAGCQSAILSSNEWHNDMNPAFISAIMAPGRLGPKRGRKCYITPAFSGVPNKGNKIKTQNLRRGSP